MNSMRNLEKLGILVIVILVVVVGVVAITPGEQLDRALDLVPEDQIADRDRVPEIVPPAEDPDRRRENDRSANQPPVDPLNDSLNDSLTDSRTDPVPDWPVDRRTPSPKGPSVTPPVADVPIPEPAPARPSTYTVKKGDSFYRIAERTLGSASHLKALMAANPTIKPADLDVGDVLILPAIGNAPRGSEGSAQQMPTTPDARSPAPVGPGGFYVVRNRDTLVGIAERELGSRLRWQEIARLNKDVLHGTTKIVEGMRLRLPGARPGGGTGMTVSLDPVAWTNEASGSSYAVCKNDTLSSIARRKLGSANRWPEIAKLNRGLLGDSHLIREGMDLQLPPK